MREGSPQSREDPVKAASVAAMSTEGDPEGSVRVTLRGVIVALLAPAVARIVAAAISNTRPEISIAVFMLAVVIAAVAGGLWKGVVAGLLAPIIPPGVGGGAPRLP